MSNAINTIEIVSAFQTTNGTTLVFVKGGISDYYRKAHVERHYKSRVIAVQKIGGYPATADLLVEVRTPGIADRDFYGQTLKVEGIGAAASLGR